MKIGFLNNQIDNRGTGNAVFNYAHYNELLLGNKSKIFTFPNANHDQKAIEYYVNRFGAIYNILDSNNISDIDALYHIKSGEFEQAPIVGIPYLVHAVFHPTMHGDRFAVISEWMSKRDNFPFVPHIVELPNDHLDLRKHLNIPKEATVFGRHGGSDSFDISWAWNAIDHTLNRRSDVYFVFVNTPIPIKHNRILDLGATVNRHAIKLFINTCDAMIHARNRGETFGLAVGEFAINKKHIITYDKSYEKAHIYELRGTALTYEDQESLEHILATYEPHPAHPFYDRYTPELVMQQFKEVFLG